MEQQTVRIIQPTTQEQFAQVQQLIRDFVTWHGQRHHDSTMTRDYYGNAAFEEELASLPLVYATGRNRILLALYGEQPSGCVALRELDERNCEMKRMYVSDNVQGKGIGRALAKEIIRLGKEGGFRTMKLNTSIRQTEALSLYERLGFRRVAPYYPVSDKVKDWLVFMELKL